MNRELLKEIAEVFRERRGGITWVAEPLLDKIETYLAQPEPEPVAWMSKTFPTTFAISKDVAQPEMFFTPLYTTPPDQSARIAELEDQLTKCRKLLATRVEASRLSEANEQLADQSALIVELKAALQLAKDMMIANDLSLPRTFEVIDEALAKAKGDL